MNAVMTIAGEVARIRGIALNDILSHRRTMAVARPRQEAMYLARHMTPASLPAIGRRLGGKDHTTVLHSVRRVEERIADMPGYGDEIEAMQAVIRAKLPPPHVFDLVPPADIDAHAAATRIMATLGRGGRVEIYADEVTAIAGGLLKASEQLAEAERRITALTIQVEHPPVTIVAPPVAEAPAPAAPMAAARAAVKAFDKLSADRFTPQERWSQKALDRALATLKATLENEGPNQ